MIFVGILLLMAIVAIVIVQLAYAKNKRSKSTWQEFAEAQNFRFIAGPFAGSGSRINGVYQGYNFKFETINKRHYSGFQLHTRVTIFLPGKALQRSESGTLEDRLNRMILMRIPIKQDGEIRFDLKQRLIAYEWPGFEGDASYLNSLLNPLSNLLDVYLMIDPLEWEVISQLEAVAKTNNLIANYFLRDICLYTNHRQKENPKLLCVRCLTRLRVYKIQSTLYGYQTYYGCRTCKQSQSLWNGKVIALLDSRLEDELSEQDDALRVNWLIHRPTFDFDAVAILQATDEDVERFAVQIGNDTDQFRKPRYQQMTCTVSQACHLSENTLRILKRTFGQVVID